MGLVDFEVEKKECKLFYNWDLTIDNGQDQLESDVEPDTIVNPADCFISESRSSYIGLKQRTCPLTHSIFN